MTSEKESCCSSIIASSWLALIFMFLRGVGVSLLFYSEDNAEKIYFLLRLLLEFYCIGDILLLIGLAKKIESLVKLWIMKAMVFFMFNFIALFMFDSYPREFDHSRGLIIQLLLCSLMFQMLGIMVTSNALHSMKKPNWISKYNICTSKIASNLYFCISLQNLIDIWFAYRFSYIPGVLYLLPSAKAFSCRSWHSWSILYHSPPLCHEPPWQTICWLLFPLRITIITRFMVKLTTRKWIIDFLSITMKMHTHDLNCNSKAIKRGSKCPFGWL